GGRLPGDNPLACAGHPDITSGLRGKGGGPTACMAVGLARWLSASRRPAGACERCVLPWQQRSARSSAVAGQPWWLVRVPHGGGRRIHGRHRTPGLTGLVQPVPVTGLAPPGPLPPSPPPPPP